MFRAIHAVLPPLLLALSGALMMAMFPLSLLWLGAIVLVFGALDTRGRYRDYKYASRFGFVTHRMGMFYGRSFCGRWMIASIHPSWRTVYHNQGYRWWHFLPDDFATVVFKATFWKNLFGGHAPR